MDSKRSGSLSKFYSRDANILRFSIDSFLFPNVQTDVSDLVFSRLILQMKIYR